MSFFLESCVSNAIVATCLAIAAAAVGRLCHRPPLIHTVWLLVLLKLVTPPLVRIPIVWHTGEADASRVVSEEVAIQTWPVEPSFDSTFDSFATVEAVSGNERSAAEMTPPSSPSTPLDTSSEAHASMSLWGWLGTPRTVTWLWLGGSCCWFTAALVRILRFHLLLRHGQPASRMLEERGASIARRLEMRRCPRLWIVPGRVSPLLWAVGGRARLILPQQLLTTLGPDQQAALLAHELAHARRLDHWVRWVEFMALGLYWWHPVAWMARRAIRQAEEQCCDAWVVWALPGRARAYAEALLETVGFLSGVRGAVPVVASGVGHAQLLRRRLTMILRETLSPRISGRARVAAIVFAMCVLPLAPYHATAMVAEPHVIFDSSAGQTDRGTSELERRINALEKKLDQVLSALEGSEKTRGQEFKEKARAQAAQKAKEARQVGEHARQEAEAARKASDASMPKSENARKHAEKNAAGSDTVDPEEFAVIARQIAESIQGSFNPERMAEMGRQIGEAIRTGVDPEQMAELGRQIAEAVNKNWDPKQMEELGRRIEVSVNENFSPERMKELERQIEEAVTKAFDPKRMEEMERAIEKAVGNTFDPDQMKELERGIERATKRIVEIQIDEGGPKAKTTTKSETTQPEPRKPVKRQPTSGTREPTRSEEPRSDSQKLERRIKALEEKMDRLLDAFESSKSPSQEF